MDQATNPELRFPNPAEKADIYSELRNRIINWNYPPGFHLGEKSLCDEFQMSRIPVREALRTLAAEGFVDKIPNQGCFVKQLSVTQTKELFEIRLALELHVAEQLTESAPESAWMESEYQLWSAVLESGHFALNDVNAFVDADTDFHLGLAGASGNESLCDMLADVTQRLKFVRLAVELSEERLKDTAMEHLAILDAIKLKNREAVRRKLSANIQHSSSKVEIAISRALLKAHTAE